MFAKTTLHMPSSSVITLGILVQSFAIASAIFMPRYQAYCGWTNLQTLVRLVIAGCVIPGYASLGVLLGSRRWGLVTPGEMYAASIWFGLVSLNISIHRL
jgi:UMF1 family MFS transporter